MVNVGGPENRITEILKILRVAIQGYLVFKAAQNTRVTANAAFKRWACRVFPVWNVVVKRNIAAKFNPAENTQNTKKK